MFQNYVNRLFLSIKLVSKTSYNLNIKSIGLSRTTINYSIRVIRKILIN